MRFRSLLLALSLVLWLGSALSAQQPDASYRIRPGDELELSIYSLPQPMEQKYTVRADGAFYHPLLGGVPAAGRTVDDVRADVARRLKKRLRNPSFELGILTYAKSEVAVLGEVKNQGRYAIAPGANVLDVLALAGGLTEKADPQGALIQRKNTNIEVDLSPPGGATSPLALANGDILYVYAGNRISIAGEVQKPGIYAVSRRSTNPLADAMKACGGPKATAAVHRAQLHRPSLAEPLIISVLPDSAGNYSEGALSLQDGDAIVIPEKQAMVLGNITKQGPIPLQGGETLLDVLTSSGLNADAELSHVVVLRAEGIKSGQPKQEEYDVREAFSPDKPGTGANVPIGDGDVVFVPQKGKGLLDNFGLLNLLFLVGSYLR